MLINGTFDWVYEEELDLRDGWRWSPDGQRIAYWQLNADGVRDFDLINDTDSLYSFVTPVQYPKAGETNSAARVGVVSAAGGSDRLAAVRRRSAQPLPGPHGLGGQLRPSSWCSGSTGCRTRSSCSSPTRPPAQLRTDPHRARQRLGRRGERPDLARQGARASPGSASATAGTTSTSCRATASQSSCSRPAPSTCSTSSAIDDKGGWLYYIASPDNPTQRYLWRARLDGKGKAERVTPAVARGRERATTSSPDVDVRLAHATRTSARRPRSTWCACPTHASVRTVVANESSRRRWRR